MATEKEQQVGLGEVAAVGSIAAGAGLLSKNKNKITGIENLYHGTGKENAEKIKQEGLKTQFAGEGASAKGADLENKLGKDQIEGKVYLGRKERVSRDFANQAAARIMGSEAGVALELFNETESPMDVFRGLKQNGEILKVNIPYDDLKEMKEVVNPDLRGMSREEFSKMLAEQTLNPDGVNYKKEGLTDLEPGKFSRMIAEMYGKKVYNDLGRDTLVLENDIDPKYIKGSDVYQGMNLKGWADYVRQNPKRFMTGAGLGALGAGAAGVGANHLYDSFLNSKEAMIYYSERMEKTAADVYYGDNLQRAEDLENAAIVGLTLGAAAAPVGYSTYVKADNIKNEARKSALDSVDQYVKEERNFMKNNLVALKKEIDKALDMNDKTKFNQLVNELKRNQEALVDTYKVEYRVNNPVFEPAYKAYVKDGAKQLLQPAESLKYTMKKKGLPNLLFSSGIGAIGGSLLGQGVYAANELAKNKEQLKG